MAQDARMVELDDDDDDWRLIALSPPPTPILFNNFQFNYHRTRVSFSVYPNMNGEWFVDLPRPPASVFTSTPSCSPSYFCASWRSLFLFVSFGSTTTLFLNSVCDVFYMVQQSIVLLFIVRDRR